MGVGPPLEVESIPDPLLEHSHCSLEVAQAVLLNLRSSFGEISRRSVLLNLRRGLNPEHSVTGVLSNSRGGPTPKNRVIRIWIPKIATFKKDSHVVPPPAKLSRVDLELKVELEVGVRLRLRIRHLEECPCCLGNTPGWKNLKRMEAAMKSVSEADVLSRNRRLLETIERGKIKSKVFAEMANCRWGSTSGSFPDNLGHNKLFKQ